MNSTTELCERFRGTYVEKSLKSLAYTIISLLGLLGNGLVLMVFRRRREMRSVVFYFIANMATSDLVLPLFAFPRALVEIFHGPMTWLIGGSLGAVSCKLATFLQDISTAVSIQSLIIIAVERFVLLFYPSKSFLRSQWKLKLVIIMTWATAMALHAPYLRVFKVSNFRNQIYCIPRWSENTETNMTTSKAYYVFIFTVLYAIPFLILIALYAVIVFSLKTAYKEQELRCARKRRRQERNRTVTIMAMIVVVAFFACWTPFITFGFLLCFHWNLRLPCDQINFRYTVLLIAHFNSAINPCIYLMCSKKFRHSVQACLKLSSSLRSRKS